MKRGLERIIGLALPFFSCAGLLFSSFLSPVPCGAQNLLNERVEIKSPAAQETKLDNFINWFISDSLGNIPNGTFYNNSFEIYSSKTGDTSMYLNVRAYFPDPDIQTIDLTFAVRNAVDSKSDYRNVNLGSIDLFVVYPNNAEVWSSNQSCLVRRLRDGAIGKKNFRNVPAIGLFEMEQKIEGYTFKYSSELLGISQALIKTIMRDLNTFFEGHKIEEAEMKFGLLCKKPIRIEKIPVPPVLSLLDIYDEKARRIELRWKSQRKGDMPLIIYFVCQPRRTIYFVLPILDELLPKAEGVIKVPQAVK